MFFKKRGVVFLVLIFSIIFLHFVFALGEETLDSVNEKTDSLEEKLEDIKNIDDSDYLAQKWKDFLLKNEFISFIDNFLNNISKFFFFLFGSEYSFSLTFFFIFVFWFVFLVIFINTFTTFSLFQIWTSRIVGLLMSMLFGHLGIYKFSVGLVTKFVNLILGFFNSDSIVANIVKIILYIFILVFLFLIAKYYNSFALVMKKIREQNELKQDVQESKTISKQTRDIIKPLTKI